MVSQRDAIIYQAYLDDLRENDNISWDRISENLDIDLSTRRMRYIARKLYKEYDGQPIPVGDIGEEEYKEEGETQYNYNETGETVVASAQRIRSLEQLKAAIKENGGNLKPWRESRHEVNVWEAGRKNKVVDLEWVDGVATGTVKDDGGWTNKANWQVKAVFVPREEYPLEQAVERIINRLAGYAPTYNPPEPYYTDGEYLSVWSLFDAHFGKRSVDGAYTVKKARDDFKRAGDALAARTRALGMPVKRILIPVGQDALEADNLAGTTTKGTWVELAADIRDAIDALCEAVVYVTEVAASIAPVDLLAIEDNHSRYSSYWLGKFAEAWFHSYPRVTVNSMRSPRKYYQFGKNLLGIDHGDTVKPQDLALKMAIEAPEMWAQTTYREWLRGHLHKRSSMYHAATEESGVYVRILPSLSPANEWHLLHGFIGNHRAAESLYYHSEYGPAGSFPVFVDDLIGVEKCRQK